MPWSVLPEPERVRHRAREANDRTRGVCHDTIASVVAQSSALLRRRGSEDMATVSALIRRLGHCVPCISVITQLDARRIYAAIERLREETNVQLLAARCARCARQTTVHIIEP